MSKLDEKDIIAIFAAKLNINNLDDVALIDKKNIVLKSDMLVEGTDVPPGMEPWQIARKSMVSCISDFASKGIKPYAGMISLGLPASYCTRRYIEGLSEGFALASKEFGVNIIGGDTNEANEVIIDCSVIGFSRNKIPSRSGAKPGDIVTVSGLFGLPPAGLAILMQNAISTGAFKKQAIKSVLEPLPRQHFGFVLAKFFSSSLDSSDGLAISLYELAESSRVDLVIDNIPIADGISNFAKENNVRVNKLVFYGGEEYEIIATIPKEKLKQAQLAGRRAGLSIHAIGKVQKGKGRVLVKDKMLKKNGYLHFGR
jgi:thiamine-monophosphate kinase